MMQGAVRMAQWELKYGSNAQLLNISQSIVTSQTEEINQMQSYLTMVPGCASGSAPSPSMVNTSHPQHSGQEVSHLIVTVTKEVSRACAWIRCPS